MQDIPEYIIRKLNQKFPKKKFVVEKYIDARNFTPFYQIIVDGKYTILRNSSFEYLIDSYNLMGAEKFRTEYLLGILIPMAVSQVEIADLPKDHEEPEHRYLV